MKNHCNHDESQRRFWQLICVTTAALVDNLIRLIMLHYHSFCPLYEKWPETSIKTPKIMSNDLPDRPTAQ